jgi:hypothetical protein
MTIALEGHIKHAWRRSLQDVSHLISSRYWRTPEENNWIILEVLLTVTRFNNARQRS